MASANPTILVGIGPTGINLAAQAISSIGEESPELLPFVQCSAWRHGRLSLDTSKVLVDDDDDDDGEDEEGAAVRTQGNEPASTFDVVRQLVELCRSVKAEQRAKAGGWTVQYNLDLMFFASASDVSCGEEIRVATGEVTQAIVQLGDRYNSSTLVLDLCDLPSDEAAIQAMFEGIEIAMGRDPGKAFSISNVLCFERWQRRLSGASLYVDDLDPAEVVGEFVRFAFGSDIRDRDDVNRAVFRPVDHEPSQTVGSGLVTPFGVLSISLTPQKLSRLFALYAIAEVLEGKLSEGPEDQATALWKRDLEESQLRSDDLAGQIAVRTKHELSPFRPGLPLEGRTSYLKTASSVLSSISSLERDVVLGRFPAWRRELEKRVTGTAEDLSGAVARSTRQQLSDPTVPLSVTFRYLDKWREGIQDLEYLRSPASPERLPSDLAKKRTDAYGDLVERIRQTPTIPSFSIAAVLTTLSTWILAQAPAFALNGITGQVVAYGLPVITLIVLTGYLYVTRRRLRTSTNRTVSTLRSIYEHVADSLVGHAVSGPGGVAEKIQSQIDKLRAAAPDETDGRMAALREEIAAEITASEQEFTNRGVSCSVFAFSPRVPSDLYSDRVSVLGVSVDSELAYLKGVVEQLAEATVSLTGTSLIQAVTTDLEKFYFEVLQQFDWVSAIESTFEMRSAELVRTGLSLGAVFARTSGVLPPPRVVIEVPMSATGWQVGEGEDYILIESQRDDALRIVTLLEGCTLNELSIRSRYSPGGASP